MSKDFYFGETWTFSGVLTDFSGAPLPLSGVSLEFHLGTSGEQFVSYVLGEDDEVRIVDPAAGSYGVVVPAAAQSLLPRSLSVFRVEVRATTSSGDATIVVSRRIRVGGSSFS